MNLFYLAPNVDPKKILKQIGVKIKKVTKLSLEAKKNKSYKRMRTRGKIKINIFINKDSRRILEI